MISTKIQVILAVNRYLSQIVHENAKKMTPDIPHIDRRESPFSRDQVGWNQFSEQALVPWLMEKLAGEVLPGPKDIGKVLQNELGVLSDTGEQFVPGRLTDLLVRLMDARGARNYGEFSMSHVDRVKDPIEQATEHLGMAEFEEAIVGIGSLIQEAGVFGRLDPWQENIMTAFMTKIGFAGCRESN